MFALLRFLGRRLAGKQLQKSRWLRRVTIGVAIVRWVSKRLSRPETIYLSRDEQLDVAVSKRNGRPV